jgi:hypothetical protein
VSQDRGAGTILLLHCWRLDAACCTEDIMNFEDLDQAMVGQQVELCWHQQFTFLLQRVQTLDLWLTVHGARGLYLAAYH